MQRDPYAALVKLAHRLKIPVSILQMNGRVTRENIYEDCFFGYAARRIVLMTNMAGIEPVYTHLPRLPQDIMVPDFPTFLNVHKPHYQYQLVPLMCRDVETLAAMQGICASQGSPFRLASDRREPKMLRLRLSNGCSNRQLAADFFKGHISPAEWSTPVASRRLPLQEVQFDGVLYRAARRVASTEKQPAESHRDTPSLAAATEATSTLLTAALYLTTHTHLNDALVPQRMHLRNFYHSHVYDIMGPNSDVHREVKQARDVWHVMAVTQPMDPVLRLSFASAAATKNLILFEKSIDGVYRYVQPPRQRTV